MSYCLLVGFILTLHMVGGNKVSENTVINDNETTVPPVPPVPPVPTEQPRQPAESTWRTTVRTPSNTINAKHGGPQDQLGQCAWWCNELYGIVALSSAGILLIISIVLGSVSCCLWRRIKCSKLEDFGGHQLDTFGPRDALGSGTFLPVQEEPPTANNGGIPDVENCSPDSELPKTETPQYVEDQTAHEAANFPPPEDLPMLS